jgi:hypothetical protein
MVIIYRRWKVTPNEGNPFPPGSPGPVQRNEEYTNDACRDIS